MPLFRPGPFSSPKSTPPLAPVLLDRPANSAPTPDVVEATSEPTGPLASVLLDPPGPSTDDSTDNPTPAPKLGLSGCATWPKHVADVYSFFMKTNSKLGCEREWGVGWEECVEEYIEFQRLSGFPDEGEAYDTVGRPAELKKWMKSHRLLKENNVGVVFSRKYMAWWSSLQPAQHPHTADSDWTTLRKAGKNGLLLVVLALVWWGGRGSSSRDAEWIAAVCDVTRAVRYMRISMPLDVVPEITASEVAGVDTLKRRRQEDTGPGLSTKKKKKN